jgi:hypothetical protein
VCFIETSSIVGLHERGQRCLRSGSIVTARIREVSSRRFFVSFVSGT